MEYQSNNTIYRIHKLDGFTLVGQEIELSNFQRKNETLFYYCAVPEDFIKKEIPSHTYFVVEHIGAMDKIYETYGKIYRDMLPNTKYMPLQIDFLHFEKYDYRFSWNRNNSIIEVWIPIKNEIASSKK